ncbi:MAG: hypothetical protein FWF56_01775 [Firmicutes bacterium]|nr:hypothetical protein [Bacillota bacterium]MCL1953800.1 hypothetical protein [Bacillota bacterium]
MFYSSENLGATLAFLIPSIAIIAIVCICLRIYFLPKHKQNSWIKKIPIIVIASVLIVLEIAKIVYTLNNVYIFFQTLDDKFIGFYAAPFHISSIPIYALSVAAFSKPNSKVEKCGYLLSGISCIVVGFSIYIIPQSIAEMAFSAIQKGDRLFFTDYHSVIYHIIVAFAACIILTMLYVDIRKSDGTIDTISIFVVLGFLLVYICIICVIADITGVNFANFLVSDSYLWQGVPIANMFLNVGYWFYSIIGILFYWIIMVIALFVAFLLPSMISKSTKIKL